MKTPFALLIRVLLWSVVAVLFVMVLSVLPLPSLPDNPIRLAFWSIAPLVWPADATPPVAALIVPLLIFAALAGPLIAFAVRRRRRQTAAAVLGHVHNALSLNLPLEPMLAAGARSEPGRAGQRLRKLHRLLEQGKPLALALPAALPELNESAVRWIEASGSLNGPNIMEQALARILARRRSGSAEVRPMQAFYHWYPLLVMAVLCGVWLILDIWVYPKLIAVTHDFSFRMPPATQWAIWIIPRIVAAILILLLLWLLLVILRRLTAPWRTSSIGPTLGDRLIWLFPLTRRLAIHRGMEDACRWMALALQAGRPLDRALEQAAILPANGVLRLRLSRWARQIIQGQPVADAARQCKLPPFAWGMLKATPAADLPRTFDFLSAAYAAQYGRAMILLRAAYIPAVVLAMGVLVGLFSLALLLPLREVVLVLERGF